MKNVKYNTELKKNSTYNKFICWKSDIKIKLLGNAYIFTSFFSLYFNAVAEKANSFTVISCNL